MGVAHRLIAMSMFVTYSSAMLFVCDASPPSAPVPHTSSTLHARDHTHAHSHDEVGRRVVPAAHPDRHEARAEWKAKCMCGCSDAHFQPGHGTARLGSVVPGAVMTRFVEAVPRSVPVRSPDRPSEVFLEIDPVPI